MTDKYSALWVALDTDLKSAWEHAGQALAVTADQNRRACIREVVFSIERLIVDARAALAQENQDG